MKEAAGPAAPSRIDVATLAERFVACFPKIDTDGRRIAVTLYRLLAQGDAVSPRRLAEAATVHERGVAKFLRGLPGVVLEGDDVVGFLGLTPRQVSRHRFHVEGRTLYTWCAWDALFLPAILGKLAHVDSEDPRTGTPIRLTVTPRGVDAVDPAATVISMLEPREDMMADVVGRLCQYIHFFAASGSGEAWVSEHPGTLLMTLDEAFEVGRLKNEARYGDALHLPPVR